MAADPVDAIFARHGVRGPWEPLRATGIANRIYATRDVVLRVATDHPDAVADARTESVAAPAAGSAGIRVPRLLAFDDSRAFLDRPYSLWQRVHGETLGLCAPDPRSMPQAWREVGRELARLHTAVRECPDPRSWLDQPGRDFDLERRLAAIETTGSIAPATSAEIRRWIDALRPAVEAAPAHRFLHNDVHGMNILCARDGSLLALIDWGDAGWGDPALELAQVPVAAVPAVREGYAAEAPALFDPGFEARVVWDKLDRALEALEENPPRSDALDALRPFIGCLRLT
jgi:aminoglycoside phosphotransferase (APT) family kinase protein